MPDLIFNLLDENNQIIDDSYKELFKEDIHAIISKDYEYQNEFIVSG